ncbi:glycosyltransferase involved in cell wall biosynthesis [Rhodoblastus acidophilus]|uniref:glycosyltransferase family 4 protein n=1 Tax=Rhodoblastus acidophilus TaxID=1074 RepID=UPI00222590E7|nr:glycosyltransferase family 4 protein [Rhodoblastus acidophilus]MCW2285386.1 glycosyltransferase involved in cell wall biosynthesis [Rhodoblastus acidophilus]MCW2334366.1 glycosyltransferase involved in cell wall biosynthesis [Rhodoblastus acidophilus]
MPAHLLFIGGEDHHMRLPFMLALKARGYRISAAASGDPGPFAKAGLDFWPITFDRYISPFSDLKSVDRLAKALRRINADVAHCFDTKLGVLTPLAAAELPRTRIVRTINGRGWMFSSRSPVALGLRLLYPALQRRAARRTDATVFEHDGDRRFFAQHRLLDQSVCEVIPGAGIDVEGFDRSRANGVSRTDLRQMLDLGDAPVVFTATRVTRQKGIPALLKAARLVHGQRPDVRFVIAGPCEGSGRFAMRPADFEAHAPYVVYLGSRSDVPSLLGMADIFAFPSEYAEGVPRAVMEAALAELPIVATELSGCREIVDPGRTGLLTPLRDPKALANAVLELLRDPVRARRMGANASPLIRGAFGLDNVVARHAALYERLLRLPSSESPRDVPRRNECLLDPAA